MLTRTFRRVSSESTPQEIRKAYRTKSLQLHPDKNPGREREAAQEFAEVANAYEVLVDAETRRDYDYVLAHPEEFLFNHYRYYKHKYRQLDGRLVFAAVILLLSVLQFANLHLQHGRAKRYAANHPVFKRREAQLRKQRLAEIEAEVGYQGKKGKRMAKKLLESEIQAGEGPRLDVEFAGGTGWGRKPRLTDLLVWKVLLVPFALASWLYRNSRWIILYNLLGRQYSFTDAGLATASALGISRARWGSMDVSRQAGLVRKRLWVSCTRLPSGAPPTESNGSLSVLSVTDTPTPSIASQVPANKEAFLQELKAKRAR